MRHTAVLLISCHAQKGRVAAIPEIEAFAIGHNIVARAVLVGMTEAVREMKALIAMPSPEAGGR